MFGVLGYGYEYLTGSDLGDDIVAGGQYLYDAGGQLVADTGSAVLETTGDIYGAGGQLLEDFTTFADEQSGFKSARETARRTSDAITEGTRKATNVLTYAAIGAGVIGAGLLAIALGRK